MIALTTLWAIPWVKKAVFYVGISMAILYAGKLWLNKHDAKVRQEERTRMEVQLEKKKQAEWEAKTKTLEEQAALLDIKAAEIAKDRQSITRTLDERLRNISTHTQADSVSVAAVPDDGLDAALRTISDELAAQP